ncbi:TonB-dependent receptor [Dethiosulfatarculus sandiegensis]|uniref:TonB-denpendent receptor n=1 Tax=Dethiosulfatarculus sandiegensis TaxID=1429043 RepID=A0A0D2HNX1_9BACT|nr:TonB-dependent receptor [Dethiosulfatarculus sandiegensis]KIX12258.1 hypothetical protein X474_19770 [Dethiosulfatarculus sandiegensis]
MQSAIRKILVFGTAAAALGLFASGNALAKIEKQPNSSRLGQMIVTAQKQEENIRKVPVSMQAFSGEALEKRGVFNVDEITRYVPNVYLQRDSYANNLVIRGVTPMSNTLSSPAGVYIDDVPLVFNYMFNWDLYDLKRVEVLRGPQGTIYGCNTESGLIKIVTKQPGNDLQGKVFTDLGLYDTSHGSVPSYKLGASVSGPMVEDTLYLGFAGQVENSDGFMKNIYNDDDEIGRVDRSNARATLRWTPSQKWDIALIGDVLSTDDGDGLYRFTKGPLETERNKVNYDYTKSKNKQTSNGQNLRIKYQGETLDLVSVTGRRNWECETAGDLDLSFMPYGFSEADYESSLINQEFRISSAAQDKDPWKWLLGLYLFQQDDDVVFSFSTFGSTKSELDSQGAALFGQTTYTFFERLHLTAGLRFEQMDQSGDQTVTDLSQTNNSWSKDIDNQEVLPRVAVSYDLTPQTMAYASAAKGYLSGGYRFWNNSSVEQFSYEPEYTWNYEMGLKTSLWQDRLALNLSVFYIDMQDKQVLEYSPDIGDSELRNAAEAHSQGFELEATAILPKGFEVFAGFGYTEAKIDNWLATEMDDMGRVYQYDYSDKDLPDVPKYTYNLGLQYRHAAGWTARVDFLGVGEFYNDATNLVQTDAYNIVNLRLGYVSEKYEVILWSKNLFDEDYFTKKYDWGGSIMGYEAAPRMVGLSLAWRF